MVCTSTRGLTLSQAKALLKPLMPGRLEAIAEVCEDEDTTAPLFYFAEYEYGDLVVKEGKFVPPCGTHTSCAECRELSRYASYSHIPLAFVQRNAVEVFAGETRASRQGKTVPLRVLAAGEMFGVFETLDYLLGSKLDPPSYSVSAGARSVWVLAPLGDVRLTKLIGEETGTDLEWDRNESHWSLIQAATRNSAKWKTSVVVFSESFVRLLKESESAASAFRQLLLETGWQQSAALRHTAGKNAFLRAWYLDGPARTLPMPLGELYQFATICHLLSIAEGDYPAYQSIGAGEHVLGPFEIFEKILGNALCALRAKVPQASTYYPVVLQPAHLNVNCPAGYYSFRCPSLLGSVDHNVTNYSDTIAPIAKTLHSLCESKSGISIDLEKTLFFAQAG